MTETRTATRGGRRGSLRVLQPPRLRLGLSTGALYPTPTEDVPDAAARAGLFDLEIMLQTPGEYGTGFIRELSARCRNAGSRVHAVHLWQELHPLLSPVRAARARGPRPVRAGHRRRGRAGGKSDRLAWSEADRDEDAGGLARISSTRPWSVAAPAPRPGCASRSRMSPGARWLRCATSSPSRRA